MVVLVTKFIVEGSAMKNKLSLSLSILFVFGLAGCAGDVGFTNGSLAGLNADGSGQNTGEIFVPVDTDDNGSPDSTARIVVPVDRGNGDGSVIPPVNSSSNSDDQNGGGNSNNESADDDSGSNSSDDETEENDLAHLDCKVLNAEEVESDSKKYAFCHIIEQKDGFKKIQQCLPLVAIQNKIERGLGVSGLCN